jgi:hypothetical protein
MSVNVSKFNSADSKNKKYEERNSVNLGWLIQIQVPVA